MELSAVLKGFAKQRILVVGDLILDRYIWGRVDRISPEAPVPVVEVTGDTSMPGGAANVAYNIVSLGGKATVIGVTGRDKAANTLKELMALKGIDLVEIEDKRPTTVKTRVIAHNQHIVRFDQEDREKVGGGALKGIISSIKELLPGHDAVIISDYKKGVVSRTVMSAVLEASRGEKFIAVDPKTGHFHLYKGVSLITPNLLEASHGSGIEIRDEKTLEKAGMRLLGKLGCKAVLITRGKDGMSLFRKEGVIHIPTFARRVYDVTGAGDTVIATFTLSYAAKASFREAAMLSNHAAGIVVAEVGTAAPTVQKLRRSLQAHGRDLTG